MKELKALAFFLLVSGAGRLHSFSSSEITSGLGLEGSPGCPALHRMCSQVARNLGEGAGERVEEGPSTAVGAGRKLKGTAGTVVSPMRLGRGRMPAPVKKVTLPIY